MGGWGLRSHRRFRREAGGAEQGGAGILGDPHRDIAQKRRETPLVRERVHEPAPPPGRAHPPRHGIPHRQPGTSHVTFAPTEARPLTVPARKPIKPVYVRLFVRMIEELTHAKESRESDD